MTAEPLTPTRAHEQLDTNGWLDASRSPGVYALRITDPPDSHEAVFRQWVNYHDAAPQHVLDGLAAATRLAYVGASGHVYDRLMDHARADVRRAAILRVFPPVEVLGVSASEDPFDAEFNYAREWVEEGYDVWVDGGLI